MRKFLVKIVAFLVFLCSISEIVIRTFRLVPDTPERFIDEYGIQRYKPGQSGFYTKAKTTWNVNEFGWLGTNENIKDSTISIIGDSYIENIMNPLECNQGNILKQYFPNYGFFEAGRSGITFIEAMEISKILEIEIKPIHQLLYLSERDFYESISEINRYSDRLQFSVKNNKLLHTHLKSPGLKKILYNVKLLYYLYLRFPVFVEKQNKGEVSKSVLVSKEFDRSTLNELLRYCSENYDLKKNIYVFHPNTDNRIIELINDYGIKTILLNSDLDKSWALSNHDGHWSCYGHNQVSKQVAPKLKEFMK